MANTRPSISQRVRTARNFWSNGTDKIPFNEVADDIKRREYLEQVKTTVTGDDSTVMVVFDHIPEVRPEDLRLFTEPRRRGTNDPGPM